MAKKRVTSGVSDFTVSIFDNGFTVLYSGKDCSGDWAEGRVVTTNLEELYAVIDEIILMSDFDEVKDQSE